MTFYKQLFLLAACLVLATLSANVSAQLIGNFEFTDSYADSLGNFSDLVPISGTVSNVTGTGGTLEGGQYSFNDADGLQLMSNLSTEDFRIEMDVTFSDLSGWDKLIDFQKDDRGFYVDTSDRLTFFGAGSPGAEVLTISTPYTVAIERDTSTNEIRTSRFTNNRKSV